MIDFSPVELEDFARAVEDEDDFEPCAGGCGGRMPVGGPHCETCNEDDVAAERESRKRYAAWRMERHACRDHVVDGICNVCVEYDRTHADGVHVFCANCEGIVGSDCQCGGRR